MEHRYPFMQRVFFYALAGDIYTGDQRDFSAKKRYFILLFLAKEKKCDMIEKKLFHQGKGAVEWMKKICVCV